MTIKQRIADIVANHEDCGATAQLLTDAIMDAIDQQLTEAKRYRMMIRLGEAMCEPGDSALSDAADAISGRLELQYGPSYASQHSGLLMALMMDQLIEQFPEDV